MKNKVILGLLVIVGCSIIVASEGEQPAQAEQPVAAQVEQPTPRVDLRQYNVNSARLDAFVAQRQDEEHMRHFTEEIQARLEKTRQLFRGTGFGKQAEEQE